MMHTPMDWPVSLSERLAHEAREIATIRGMCELAAAVLLLIVLPLSILIIGG